MKPTAYFAEHPVFRYLDFATHQTKGGRSAQTTPSVLHQHLAAGNLVHVRRALYATVPPRLTPENVLVDPYLLATNLAPDAFVAYHAALQFLGKANSLWNRFHFCTGERSRPFYFRDMEFLPVQVPAHFREQPERGGGVKVLQHAGGKVRVTSLERTLVDVFDAPEKAGGWEEIWRSLDLVDSFDLDAVVAYAEALGVAITAARVGYYLSQHRETLMVDEAHLSALRALAPRQPRYFEPSRQSGRLVPEWNLVVPEAVLEKQWEEVG